MSFPMLDNAPAREGCRMVYLSEQPPQHEEAFTGFGDLLSIKEMCAITGLSAQTIRTCCASGTLPAAKIGRAWFVPKSKLIEYLDCGYHAS